MTGTQGPAARAESRKQWAYPVSPLIDATAELDPSVLVDNVAIVFQRDDYHEMAFSGDATPRHLPGLVRARRALEDARILRPALDRRAPWYPPSCIEVLHPRVNVSEATARPLPDAQREVSDVVTRSTYWKFTPSPSPEAQTLPELEPNAFKGEAAHQAVVHIPSPDTDSQPLTPISPLFRTSPLAARSPDLPPLEELSSVSRPDTPDFVQDERTSTPRTLTITTDFSRRRRPPPPPPSTRRVTINLPRGRSHLPTPPSATREVHVFPSALSPGSRAALQEVLQDAPASPVVRIPTSPSVSPRVEEASLSQREATPGSSAGVEGGASTSYERETDLSPLSSPTTSSSSSAGATSNERPGSPPPPFSLPSPARTPDTRLPDIPGDLIDPALAAPSALPAATGGIDLQVSSSHDPIETWLRTSPPPLQVRVGARPRSSSIPVPVSISRTRTRRGARPRSLSEGVSTLPPVSEQDEESIVAGEDQLAAQDEISNDATAPETVPMPPSPIAEAEVAFPAGERVEPAAALLHDERDGLADGPSALDADLSSSSARPRRLEVRTPGPRSPSPSTIPLPPTPPDSPRVAAPSTSEDTDIVRMEHVIVEADRAISESSESGSPTSERRFSSESLGAALAFMPLPEDADEERPGGLVFERLVANLHRRAARRAGAETEASPSVQKIRGDRLNMGRLELASLEADDGPPPLIEPPAEAEAVVETPMLSRSLPEGDEQQEESETPEATRSECMHPDEKPETAPRPEEPSSPLVVDVPSYSVQDEAVLGMSEDGEDTKSGAERVPAAALEPCIANAVDDVRPEGPIASTPSESLLDEVHVRVPGAYTSSEEASVISEDTGSGTVALRDEVVELNAEGLLDPSEILRQASHFRPPIWLSTPSVPPLVSRTGAALEGLVVRTISPFAGVLSAVMSVPSSVVEDTPTQRLPPWVLHPSVGGQLIDFGLQSAVERMRRAYQSGIPPDEPESLEISYALYEYYMRHTTPARAYTHRRTQTEPAVMPPAPSTSVVSERERRRVSRRMRRLSTVMFRSRDTIDDTQDVALPEVLIRAILRMEDADMY